MQQFKTWIEQFKNDDTPFGDLARDIAQDDNFPTSNKYKNIHDYLAPHALVLETFEKAWEYYSANK